MVVMIECRVREIQKMKGDSFRERERERDGCVELVAFEAFILNILNPHPKCNFFFNFF